MKLESLEISGFGRLGDLRLDLSPRLTVVLGANESGKSTVHRAIRGALYGLDAGGQGRAAARSDWARWRPWDAPTYGIALIYVLSDGRRFRVARRLEQREERVQVQELGGRDVTDLMRSGRACLPGLHHLGLDEAVFCASAWVGEESLDLGCADAPAARADRIQEAIERVADAAGRSTAGEALARLRTAMDRVGTEARSKSPLGAACLRLRTVEDELDRVRRRVDTLAADQHRLREVEAGAAAADGVRRDAERAWLVGRLTQLAAHREALATARQEAGRLESSVAEWRAFEAFPYEREERVTAVGVELRLAIDAAAEAAARWDAARAEVRATERRRMEIATSIRALGSAPRVSPADRETAAMLSDELAGEGGVERRVEAVASASGRLDGLRREVAATGLGSVPLGKADEVAELVAEARQATASQRLRPLAGGAVVLAALAGSALVLAHARPLALATIVSLMGVAGLLLLAERLAGGPGVAARRRLSRMCPGLDLGDAGLERASERLPRVAALHEDLRRQQALVDAGRAELEETSQRLADLAARCLLLAAHIPVEVADPAVPMVGPVGHLSRARQALLAVSGATEAGRRRVELEDEDARLEQRIDELRAPALDTERLACRRDDLRQEMARLCDVPGLAAEDDPAAQVSAFRQAAATRRHLEAACARLTEVRRRITALGPADDASLDRQQRQLGDELSRRGGDPQALPGELPLDPGRLHELELAAQRAAAAAAVAFTEATAMRERLAGMLDGLPSVADLDDERAACLAIRDRCLHQLDALRRASTYIEDAARRVHRDVAPRLAAAVSRTLAVVTDGRYDEVHVDAERFGVTLRAPDRLELVPVDLLSHGTRDQVALLLRLALAQVLGEGGETVPLLLDDPLQSSDPLRRAGLVDFLVRLSEHTQVLFTTSDPAIATAVAAADVPSTILELGRRSAAARADRPARRRDPARLREP